MSVSFVLASVSLLLIAPTSILPSANYTSWSKMYSSLSRNVARSGSRRVVATANRRSVSNSTAAAGRRLQNSHATADVTAIPLPVSGILSQQAAVQQARANALAFILAGGAAGLAVLSSSSAIAMCDGDGDGSVSEEEMQHDWDDFMYKAIKPGEDDDDDDDDDEDDDEVSIWH